MTYAYIRASGDGSLISRYVRTQLPFAPVKDRQYRTVFSTDFLGRLLVQLDTFHPRSVRYFHTILIYNLNDDRHRSSADGLTTNNQTNLAIKGIIAIKAMSKMSSIVERTADAQKYNVRADVLDESRGN